MSVPAGRPLDVLAIGNAVVDVLSPAADDLLAAHSLTKAVELAHGSGGRVALSLSDPAWVELHRAELNELVGDVDVLFCNEAEAIGLCGSTDLDAALAELRQRCEVVAVTRGAAGSLALTREEQHVVRASPVERVVDTTGAGDLFAAGFLVGLTRGFDLGRC